MYLQTVNNFIAEALKKKDAEAEKQHKKHLQTIAKIREANINTFVELWAIYEILEEKAEELEKNLAEVQTAANNDPTYDTNILRNNDPLTVSLNSLQFNLHRVKNEIIALEGNICEDVDTDKLKKIIKEETKKRLEA